MIAATFASSVNQMVGGDATCLLSTPVYVTQPQAISELAGRICYRSTSKMGHSSSFLSARMAEGHQDIFEHVWITASLTDEDAAVNWMEENRYVWVSRVDGGQWCYVSANMRVWMEMAQSNLVARDVVYQYLPGLIRGNAYSAVTDTPTPIVNVQQRVVGDGANGAMVNLVACHRPNIQVGYDMEMHQAATFLLQNVSRALTHQLVRHRLLSFSQESQRYVSLEKGGWYPIMPPSIAEDARAIQVLNRVWMEIEAGYEKLRELGIRKEDARYLLPNATSTTIMVSGSIAAWRGMLRQRCATDAQWEIRNVALAIRDMLSELGMYHD